MGHETAASLRRLAGGPCANDRQWLVGDSITVADFAVAVTLPHAERAHIPLDEFPAVRRWHERLNAIDAWREPFPALAEAA